MKTIKNTISKLDKITIVGLIFTLTFILPVITALIVKLTSNPVLHY